MEAPTANKPLTGTFYERLEQALDGRPSKWIRDRVGMHPDRLRRLREGNQPYLAEAAAIAAAFDRPITDFVE